MINYSDTLLAKMSIHRVGNKLQDEFYVLSDQPVEMDDEVLPDLLKHYFLSPFSKVHEVYRFFHPNEALSLNEAYHFIHDFFAGTLGFHEMTTHVCKHLYASSNHPKIKAGEVYIVHLKSVYLEGEENEAIGIFKSENKETYLKVYPKQGAFDLEYEQEAININKLDKGCLIVNTESEEGYKVLVVDQTNRQQEAVYWKDEFLQLRLRNDEFTQTGNFLKVYKEFVTDKLDESFEIERTDKIDLLNRSMTYFKEKDTFVQDEFEEEVLANPDAIQLFNDYKQQFEDETDMTLSDRFDISPRAIKKAQATYKSVLKLDRNFHIYVHGNRDYIEKGFDKDRDLHYYKVFFEQEH